MKYLIVPLLIGSLLFGGAYGRKGPPLVCRNEPATRCHDGF